MEKNEEKAGAATALLPCPFCGGPASIVKNSFPSRNPWRHPSCDNYDCPGHVEEQDEQGGTNVDCKTDEEAAELWNERTTPPNAVSVEALEGLALAWEAEAHSDRLNSGHCAYALRQLIKERSNVWIG